MSYGNNGWTYMKIQFSSLLLDIPVFWWANHRTKCAMVLPGCRWRGNDKCGEKNQCGRLWCFSRNLSPYKMCVVWSCLNVFAPNSNRNPSVLVSLHLVVFFLMLFGNPQIDLVVKCYLLLSRIKLQCWSILTKEKPIHITLHLQNVDYI